MKILNLLILLCGAVLAQESAAVQPSAQPAGQPAEIRYAHYATMFASATKGEEGIMPIVDSQGTLRIVPVSKVAKQSTLALRPSTSRILAADPKLEGRKSAAEGGQ